MPSTRSNGGGSASTALMTTSRRTNSATASCLDRHNQDWAGGARRHRCRQLYHSRNLRRSRRQYRSMPGTRARRRMWRPQFVEQASSTIATTTTIALLALLHRTSSSGRSSAAVEGSQGTASRTQSSQVDPCQLPREDHVLFALECTVSSSSEAIKAPRELSTRITEPVVALATAIDDESETDDTVNALKLKHLIEKMGGPRGSSEPLPNTSLPSTHSSVALDHVIAVVSADVENIAISVRLQEYWQDCMDYLARVVSASCITTFYVGATMDPCRRWTGHAADLWTGRGPMRGHRESYRAMHLVALMMGSDHSRFVEATLIRAGQSMGVSCVISHCLYKGRTLYSIFACALYLG